MLDLKGKLKTTRDSFHFMSNSGNEERTKKMKIYEGVEDELERLDEK